MGWSEGQRLVLLGTTREELSGSEWAHVVHGHLGGIPPMVDLPAEQRLAGLLADAAVRGHLGAAHDVSDGGLAQTLVEGSLRRGVGVQLDQPEGDPFVALFAESAGRVLATVAPDDAEAVAARARAAGVPVERLGTTGGSRLSIDSLDPLPLDELRTAWEGTLPALFATPAAVVGAVEAPR